MGRALSLPTTIQFADTHTSAVSSLRRTGRKRGVGGSVCGETSMRLLHLASGLSCEEGETFLVIEVEERLRQRCDLLVVPLRGSPSVGRNSSRAVAGRSKQVSLASVEVIMVAAAKVRHRPGMALRVLTTWDLPAVL